MQKTRKFKTTGISHTKPWFPDIKTRILKPTKISTEGSGTNSEISCYTVPLSSQSRGVHLEA